MTSDDLPTFGRPMTAIRAISASASGARLPGERRRRPLRQTVEEVAGAVALRRRDGERISEPEPMEVRRQVVVARLVDLVGDHHDGNGPAPQDLGDLSVALAQPRARVDDEHGGIGVG